MKRVLSFLFLVVCVSNVWAGDYWNAEPGASTMKFLYLKPAPRAAALGGAGIASPESPSELSRNPLAVLSAENAEIGWNQIVFSDETDADFLSLYYALPYKNFAFSAALEFIGYGDLEGRDEDGFKTGNFTASAWAIQLGAGYKHSQFKYALSARFASQTIDEMTAIAFLADGAVSVDLNRYLAFGAAVTNAGYVSEYESGHEVPPTAVQAGLTGMYPITKIFDLSLHADLYRRADSDMYGLFGGEMTYRKILTLRAGYAVRPDTDDGVSGGLGIRFGQIHVEYAYAANPTLGGDHHISIGLQF